MSNECFLCGRNRSSDRLEEIWKPIKGYEDLYEVSNLGKVRSVMFRNNKTKFKRIKMISVIDHGNGYKYVTLNKENKRKNFYVHRLVGEAFVEKMSGKNVVNHIDHNKSNNVSLNLEWVSTKENVHYSKHLMRKPKSVCKPSNTGEKYISLRKGRYRVNCRNLCADKTFPTLEEAVCFRNEVVGCV